MEFKSIYIHALREKDPKLFMALRRSGKLDAHLQQKSLEAHELLRQLLAQEPKDVAGHPKDRQAERLAEEQVFAVMLDFTVPEREQNPEPPDDLQTPRSATGTSAPERMR